MPFFTPPTISEHPLVRHPLIRRTHLDVGVTILKENGFYRQVRYPNAAECEAADAYYQGGRTYPITEQEADDLTAAGYGAYLTS